MLSRVENGFTQISWFEPFPVDSQIDKVTAIAAERSSAKEYNNSKSASFLLPCHLMNKIASLL